MSNIHVLRSKNRRIVETETIKALTEITSKLPKDQTNFTFRANQHFADRLVDRNINPKDVETLLNKVLSDQNMVDDIKEFLEKENRETRLEFTDGELYICCVIDPHVRDKSYLISLRTAIVNASRLEGSIETKVIKIK